MLFIGRTRFSLFDPKSSSWKASNGSKFRNADEYKNYLFSDERLSLRAEIFFNLSLPLLSMASEGYDVRHVVSYSEYLPEKYEQMLKEAKAKYDFLILDRQTNGSTVIDTNQFARDILTRSPDPQAPFGVYRLDDDDLLPIDFFKRCQPYITNSNIGMLVSFGAGLTAIYMDGKFYNSRECYAPMIGIGLVAIHGFDANGDLHAPVLISHNRSDRANAVILDSRALGFMWTRHIEQDSTLGTGTLSRDGLLSRIRKQINQHPPAMDTSDIQKYFPVLSGIITAAKDSHSSMQVPVGPKTRISRDPIPLQFTPKRGQIRFDFVVTGDSSCTDRNALVCFDILDDSTGKAPSGEKWVAALTQSRISFSDNTDIGYFRYLTTGNGRYRSKIEIALPDGFTLVGASLKKWRRLDANIVIQSSSVIEI